MIPIPSPTTRKFSQANSSDLFGNILATKNCNFDEMGYIKLSNRTALLKSNVGDPSFGIIPAFGRNAAGRFIAPSAVDVYDIVLSPTGIVVQEDILLNHPTSLGFTTHGRWWNNRFHVTTPTKLYYLQTGAGSWQDITLPVNAVNAGNWNATTNSPALQSGIGTAGNYYVVTVAGNTRLDDVTVWNVNDWAYFTGSKWVKAISTSVFVTTSIHVEEVFKNRNTLCISDGNRVVQFDTSYVHQVETDLILQSDYQVCGMAYSNNRMGIITRLSDTTQGENVDTYFFLWDGASPEANAGYPIGSDQAVAIVPYKSSWVILTRNGQVLYFNGGGFTVLTNFPFYFKNELWGDFQNKLAYGDAMQVDGDKILFNIPGNLNSFGNPATTYDQRFPGGVWCYDPNVGLYHRYSPSSSPIYLNTVTSSGVNVSNEKFTITAGTIPETGSPVRYTNYTSSPVGGLTPYETYYVIRVSAIVFKLALTRALALVGTPINITNNGGGNHYFLMLQVYDYGISRSSRVGALALQGVHSQIYQDIIFSSYVMGLTDSLEIPSLFIDVPFFKSIGHVIFSKISSERIEDNYQDIYLKFRALDADDELIVKYKSADVVGLPFATEQINASTAWADTKVFTTTEDLSAVKVFFDANIAINDTIELEAEIISGAGAGQYSKITDITYSAGVYTVTLEDALEGVAMGRICSVSIDTWTKAGESVTSLDNEAGFKHFPINRASKWLLAKVIMKGINPVIESFLINNAIQTPGV